MICKNISIKVNGKKQLDKNILTYNADFRAKEAAEKRNDEKILTNITGKDLIAREFETHEKCYRDPYIT